LTFYDFNKDQETQIAIPGLKSDFLKPMKVKLRSAATSLFDVQRWTFDVGRSSSKIRMIMIPAYFFANNSA